MTIFHSMKTIIIVAQYFAKTNNCHPTLSPLQTLFKDHPQVSNGGKNALL